LFSDLLLGDNWKYPVIQNLSERFEWAAHPWLAKYDFPSGPNKETDLHCLDGV